MHLKIRHIENRKTHFEQEWCPCTCTHEINSVIRSMRMCKKALGLFNITKFTLSNKHAVPFDLIATLEPYFIQDTISLHNSVLELIQNLQLHHYKNEHEAKRRLTTGCMLPVNFDRRDLFHVIKNFEIKTEAVHQVENVTIPTLRALLNYLLELFEHSHAVQKMMQYIFLWIMNLPNPSSVRASALYSHGT